MASPTPMNSLLALALAVLCLPAQSQIDPLKVKPLGKEGTPANPQGQAEDHSKPRDLPSPPPRLSSSEYGQIRSHLATQLKVSAASLASTPIPVSNLSTPGNLVHVTIGQPLPAGFSWGAQNVQAGPSWVSVPRAWVPSFHGPAYPYFTAQNVPRGTYLMSVYVATKLTSISAALHTGGPTGKFTPWSKVPVQSGKVMVPIVLPSNEPELQIWLQIPWADNADQFCVVFSCDFIRIQ